MYRLRLLHALPGGIDIPAAFKNLNNYHMFSKWESRIGHAIYLGVQTPDGNRTGRPPAPIAARARRSALKNVPVRGTFKQVQDDLEGPLVKTMARLEEPS